MNWKQSTAVFVALAAIIGNPHWIRSVYGSDWPADKDLSYGSDRHSGSVDWKLIGTSDGGKLLCFYDAKGVTKNAGHVRAWIKCIPQQSVKAIGTTSDLGKELVDKSARKTLLDYEPPIITFGRMNSESISTAIYYEMAADFGHIHPDSSILVEINCSEKMSKMLSVYIKNVADTSAPGTPWEYIPPETNIGLVQQIECAAK